MKSSGPSALHPGGWAAVPLALLRHPDVSHVDVAVYAAIASGANYVNGLGVARMWTARIAERAHVSRRTVRRAVVRLEEQFKLVRVVRRSGLANEYVLLPTAPSAEAGSDQDLEAARRMGGRPPKDPKKAPVTPATSDRGYGKPPAPVTGTPVTSDPTPGHKRPPSTDPQLDVSSDPTRPLEEASNQKTYPPGIEEEAKRRMNAARERGVDILNTRAYLTKIMDTLLEENWEEDIGTQFSIAWQEQRKHFVSASLEDCSSCNDEGLVINPDTGTTIHIDEQGRTVSYRCKHFRDHRNVHPVNAIDPDTRDYLNRGDWEAS